MKPHNLLNRTQRIEKFRSAESVLQTPYLFKFNKIDLFFRFPVLSFDSIRLMLDTDECMYVWTNVCMCFADTDGYLVVLSILFTIEISFPLSLSFYLSRLLPMICVLFQHYEIASLPINESLSLALISIAWIYIRNIKKFTRRGALEANRNPHLIMQNAISTKYYLNLMPIKTQHKLNESSWYRWTSKQTNERLSSYISVCVHLWLQKYTIFHKVGFNFLMRHLFLSFSIILIGNHFKTHS